MKISAGILVLSVVLCFGIGCGGDQATGTPEPTDTPAPIAKVAATHTPIPTSAPLPTHTPKPTETRDPARTPTPTQRLAATDTLMPTKTPEPPDTPAPTMTPEPTDAPAPEPTKEPPSTGGRSVEVLQSLSYIDEDSGWAHIIGIVVNNSDKPLGFVKIVANLVDADGKSVDTDSTYALTELMLPGDVVPFDLLLPDPPEFKDYELVTEFDVARDTDLRLTCRDFEVKETSGVTGFLGYSIIGLVKSNCDGLVDFIAVAGSVYNAEGQLIGAGTTYARLDKLFPGGSSPFKLTLPDVNVEDAASFRLVVEADVMGEPPPEEGSASPAEILQSVTYTGTLGAQRIVGLLTNNGDQPLTFVEVIASIFDSDGRFVGSESTFAATDLLLPGDVVPFDVPFFDDRFAGYQLLVQFTAADADDVTDQCRDFEINDAAQGAGLFGYEIKGVIANACADTVEYVKVVAAVYDMERNLIGVGFTYAELEELAPGATVPFEVLLIDVDATQAVSFDLIVEAEIKK